MAARETYTSTLGSEVYYATETHAHTATVTHLHTAFRTVGETKLASESPLALKRGLILSLLIDSGPPSTCSPADPTATVRDAQWKQNRHTR